MEEKIFCIGRPVFDITAIVRYKKIKEIFKEYSDKKEIHPFLKELERESNKFSISVGGVETNVAINCALLGLPSILIGAIGEDQLSVKLKTYQDNISLLNLNLQVIKDQHSGIVVVVWVEKESGDKEKIKIVNYGASEHLKFTASTRKYLKSSTIFFTSLYSANSHQLKDLWRHSVKIASKYCKKIVIDIGGIDTIPVNERKEVLRTVNTYADIVHMNELEQSVCYECFVAPKEKHIKEVFPNVKTVIVTKEQNGAVIYSGNKEISAEAELLNSTTEIFPVGAGDSFIAGFIKAMTQKKKLVDAAQFAAKIASLKLKHPSSHLLPEILLERILIRKEVK